MSGRAIDSRRSCSCDTGLALPHTTSAGRRPRPRHVRARHAAAVRCKGRADGPAGPGDEHVALRRAPRRARPSTRCRARRRPRSAARQPPRSQAPRRRQLSRPRAVDRRTRRQARRARAPRRPTHVRPSSGQPGQHHDSPTRAAWRASSSAAQLPRSVESILCADQPEQCASTAAASAAASRRATTPRDPRSTTPHAERSGAPRRRRRPRATSQQRQPRTSNAPVRSSAATSQSLDRPDGPPGRSS